jgi:hypothetical protein
MNHLTDSQLNEYLDNALDAAPRRGVQAHLQSCDDCRARLEEIQLVFDSLADLPEARLARDLSSSVLMQLPKRQTRVWTWAFAAQLGAALGALLWLSMEMAQSAPPLFSALRLPQFALPGPVSVISGFQLPAPDSLFIIPGLRFPIPAFRLPVLDLQLSTFNLVFLVTASLALWVIGNTTLLRDRMETRK